MIVSIISDFAFLRAFACREVGAVGTSPDAKNSPEDFEVHLLEIVIVLRRGSTSRTNVRQPQSSRHLACGQAEGSSRHIVKLWTESVVTYPHEPNPSIHSNHEVSVLVVMPPSYRNRTAWLYLCPATSTTNGGARDARSRICSSMISVHFFRNREACCFDDGHVAVIILASPLPISRQCLHRRRIACPTRPSVCQRFLDSASPITIEVD